MAKKIENLKEMTIEDLKNKLSQLQESLRSLHFKVEGSKSKNVKEAGSLRKQIARILTEIKVKESVK